MYDIVSPTTLMMFNFMPVPHIFVHSTHMHSIGFCLVFMYLPVRVYVRTVDVLSRLRFKSRVGKTSHTHTGYASPSIA